MNRRRESLQDVFDKSNQASRSCKQSSKQAAFNIPFLAVAHRSRLSGAESRFLGTPHFHMLRTAAPRGPPFVTPSPCLPEPLPCYVVRTRLPSSARDSLIRFCQDSIGRVAVHVWEGSRRVQRTEPTCNADQSPCCLAILYLRPSCTLNLSSPLNTSQALACLLT